MIYSELHIELHTTQNTYLNIQLKWNEPHKHTKMEKMTMCKHITNPDDYY